jgi:hypothetical protein
MFPLTAAAIFSYKASTLTASNPAVESAGQCAGNSGRVWRHYQVVQELIQKEKIS